MVLGLLGIQSQAVARVDGRLNAGGVSARLHDGRKPSGAQVVKEIGSSLNSLQGFQARIPKMLCLCRFEITAISACNKFRDEPRNLAQLGRRKHVQRFLSDKLLDKLLENFPALVQLWTRLGASHRSNDWSIKIIQ